MIPSSNFVNKYSNNPANISLDDIKDVLLLSNDEKNIKIGTPSLKGISVKAEVLEQKKNKKVIVFKKKRRKNYKRKNGHRQNITVLKILKIGSKSIKKK